MKGLASLILSLALLGSLAMAQEEAKTCNLYQTCKSNEGVGPGEKLGDCDDPAAVTQPVFWEGGYAPEVLTGDTGISAMIDACPYIDLSTAICCGADNAQIMRKFTYAFLLLAFFVYLPFWK